MNITEFLEARITEDEERAGSGWSTLSDTRWETDNYGRTFPTPSAVLAECKAKRAILKQCERLQEHANDLGAWGIDEHEGILQSLAAVYKDHPDYQKEWTA